LQARKDGRIVFSRLDPETMNTVRLYSVRGDGSDLRAITRSNGADDSQVDWNPEGSKLAFRRFVNPGEPNERVDVFAVNRDGTNERNLTRNSCSGACLGSEEPAWGPGGHRVAFVRAFGPISPDGNAARVALFVMDADGSNVRQLTQLEPNSGTEDHFPSWSPDGSRIAFLRWNASVRPRNASAIYTVHAAGGNERLLRRIPRRWPGGGTPDWSPDGSRILFTTYCYYRGCDAPATGAQLFTMNPAGGDLHKLTHVKGNAYQGGWSATGKRIVFTGNRRADGVSDIFTIRADGSKLRRLTHAKRPELFADYPDWGPRSG
jgi:Tol biopolymer transport system component